MTGAWLAWVREQDREFVRSIESRLVDAGTPAEAGALTSILAARLRHSLLYGGIRHLGIAIDSPWKIALATSLRRGDTFFDVGGNVGRISQAAAWLVGGRGRVHTFEPSPEVSDLLRRRVRYFGMRNVVVNQVALGANLGDAVLHEFTERHGGASSLRPGANPQQPHDRETPVLVTTLDHYAADNGIETARLVKIDVEGAELDVILGARRMLERLRPVLLVEASRHTMAAFGHDIGQLIEAIAGHGYEIFSWRGRRLARVRAADDVPVEIHHDDLLCLDPSAHREVRARLERLSPRRP